MFIISLIFYSLDGFMGSSFLTLINIGLGVYCIFFFLRSCIQFGLPNNILKFMFYLVTFSTTIFFSMKGLVEIGLIDPFNYIKWRVLPQVVAGLGLIVQSIFLVGQFSFIQMKVMSRLPLIGGLLIFSFFSQKADFIAGLSVLVTWLFLSISIGKAQYEKRMIFKMILFLGIFWLGKLFNTFELYILGEIFLFPALFYFFIFEQSCAVSALIQDFKLKQGSA